MAPTAPRTNRHTPTKTTTKTASNTATATKTADRAAGKSATSSEKRSPSSVPSSGTSGAAGFSVGVSRFERALLKRLPLYVQIAEDVRQQIASGDLTPGEPLPSEIEMIGKYGVSRITVRHALGMLRSAGLITTERGRPSRVRAALDDARTVELDPAVNRAGKDFHTWDTTDGWTEVEEPSRYRTEAGEHSRALGIPAAEPVFVFERQLAHPNGTQITHRVFIPFSIADGTPLEADPFQRPAQLYRILTDAGHALNWQESTRAAMPTPDDLAALSMSEGIPLLIHTRTTLNENNQPLILEETRLPADTTTIVHHQPRATPRRTKA